MRLQIQSAQVNYEPGTKKHKRKCLTTTEKRNIILNHKDKGVLKLNFRAPFSCFYDRFGL